MRAALAILATAVLLIAGCGSATPSISPSGSWVRIGSMNLSPTYLGGMIGPVRLSTGTVRFEVRLGGHPGAKALVITGFRQTGAPSPGVQTAAPVPPEGHNWWFGQAGMSTTRADLPVGKWGFTVSKSATVPATVTVYELR